MTKISLGLGALVLGVAVSAQAADLQKGKQLVEKGGCVTCHGPGLNAPISPDYPKLAGQHGDYLYHALLAYQTSGNPLMGRSNAIMAGQVNANAAMIGDNGKPRPFTQAELKDIAAYIESLPGSLVLKK
ncbi:cytochrome C [Ralstonia solanacearum]|uniref:c-type cytochrome n=1 Tax=Ralstonia solanacearum TaxID=305 RepID=UPI0001816DA3|nr:cytochrome c [Ralstonia solanacearum]MDC6176931.1 cytochrome c [Ralstonia solanacearum]MDC6212368.1 cytochrome c [Ralstonia solanacearum]MDC6241664.1 cytochrome c [Ralstonia solanacearum]MDD7799321.1 cytochrome c [Ralstonia solanacearum]TYZ53710.1 cytochrome C [Ralstonia solanacearum]